jgi:hypothetical protein
MATVQNINSGYNGALAGEILVQAFRKSDTIAKNLITVLPNNIGTGYLPRLSYSADLQDYACGFDPKGDVNYTDVEVVLKKFKIDHELCKDEFRQTFQAQSAGLFGAESEIPQDIQSAILMAIIDNLGVKVDNFIWNNPDLGLKAKLTSDGGAIGIQSQATTKANILGEMEKVYAGIPEAIIESDDLVIAVSPKVSRLYKQAQADQGLNTTVGDKELDYLGVRMESIGALSGDSMFAYRVKNLGFLTGLENDLNQVSVKDMDNSDLSGMVRTKVVLEMGAGFSFAEEIVWYGDFA